MQALSRPALHTLTRRVAWSVGLVALALVSAQVGRAQPLSSADPAHAAAALALDTSRAADHANWVVLEVRGSATWRLQDAAQWQSFKQGQVLPPGSVIETGAGGEVTLVTGGDELLIGSDSRLIVPLSTELASLSHERGRLLIHVEPRRDRSFRVRTPLLSMGIKGTSFELAVDPDQDRVLVLDGEVEVITPGSDEAIGLQAGDGLTQPATPGAPPRPFARPIPPAAWPQTAEHPWLMPDAADPGMPARGALRDQIAQGERTAPPPTSASAPASRAERPARQPAAADPTAEDPWPGWDHLPIVIGLAAGALLLLIGPGFSLLQALRAQWQDRPPAKGRRRRSLVRAP
jgi:hypothetical protein